MADPVVGFRVRILNPDGSQLEPGVDNADDSWESWKGGGVQHVKPCKPGKDTFKSDTRAGDLVLRGPVTSGRKDVYVWLEDVLGNGKSYRRMLTITELSDPGSGLALVEGKKYVYYDCFPVRYVFPRMSVTTTTGNTMEEVAIKPIRVEIV